MDKRRWPARILECRKRRQIDTGFSGPQNAWRNKNVQPVQGIGVNERGNRLRTTFDQYASQSLGMERRNNGTGRKGGGAVLDDDLSGAVRRGNPRPRNNEARSAIVGKQARIAREAPRRIYDDARGAGTGNTPDIEHRIVGQSGADTDDDRVDNRTQPMQMIEGCIVVDPAALAARQSDAPIERLAELGNHERPFAGGGLDACQAFSVGRRQAG